MKNFNFDITHRLDDRLGRVGTLHTPHGDIETPAFVVVGTKATVKGVTPEMVADLGAQVVLANTYHLYLQPGDEMVRESGGLGRMMNWPGPTVTDSGGFQVFSLGEAYGSKVSKIARGEDDVVSERREYPDNKKLATISEKGVNFRSYIDGSKHFFTPERSMEIQWNLGADIIFAFDECTSPLAPHEYQLQAMNRTHRWAQRSLDRHAQLDPDNQQALFGVVQGGRHQDLREASARALAEMKDIKHGQEFDGFGIGGSFVKEDMETAVGWVNQILPDHKPRHLLGIGDPMDLFLGIEQGCDLFDCVSPTRVARHGRLYTMDGPIIITNSKYRDDFRPLDPEVPSYTSLNYSRAYLSHLYRAKENLAGTLGSVHNLFFIVSLVDKIRESIKEGRFFEFKEQFLQRYYKK